MNIKHRKTTVSRDNHEIIGESLYSDAKPSLSKTRHLHKSIIVILGILQILVVIYVIMQMNSIRTPLLHAALRDTGVTISNIQGIVFPFYWTADNISYNNEIYAHNVDIEWPLSYAIASIFGWKMKLEQITVYGFQYNVISNTNDNTEAVINDLDIIIDIEVIIK